MRSPGIRRSSVIEEEEESESGSISEYNLQMLVELFDLTSSPDTGENWEETARWIKYEEDVEGLDRHWGRPHVAFLSFHSLMQFRQHFGKSETNYFVIFRLVILFEFLKKLCLRSNVLIGIQNVRFFESNFKFWDRLSNYCTNCPPSHFLVSCSIFPDIA